MCLIPGCLKFADKRFTGWGDGGKLCTAHYDAISNQLTQNGTFPITDSYLQDYIRIKGLMIECDTVLKQIKLLSNEMEQAVKRNRNGKSADDLDDRFDANRNSTNYLRVSRALEYYESLCWFPSCRRIFAGGLSAADFYWYLSRGFMVKDPGPNYAHGDFTHRLQWHALMRIITNNFTQQRRAPWNHTPLDLFTSMGTGVNAQANIWGSVLDRDAASPPDLMSIKSIASARTFSFPNNLHEAVLKSGKGVLQQNLARRYEKRRDIVEHAIAFIEKWMSQLPGELRESIRLHGANPEGFEVAGILYALKKRRGRPLDIERGLGPYPAMAKGGDFAAHKRLEVAHNDKWRLELAEQVAILMWNEEIRAPDEPALTPYAGRASSHGVVYSRVVSPVDGTHGVIFGERVGEDITRVSAHEVAQRVASSDTGLNPAFAYSTNTGAYPR